MDIININSGAIQFANRIAKATADNKVSKLMDSAQNICFSQSDSAKQFIYDYSNGIKIGNNSPMLGNVTVDKTLTKFYIGFDAIITATGAAYTALFNIEGTDCYLSFRFVGGLLRLVFQAYNKTGVYTGGCNFDINSFVTLGVKQRHELVNIDMDGTKRLVHYVNGSKTAHSVVGDFYVGVVELFGRTGFADYGSDVTIDNFRMIDLSDDNTVYPQKLAVGDPEMTGLYKPFIWYKRYKEDGNKKGYWNTRFLKDAVIGSDDKITSLESELNNTTLVAIAGQEPKWTKNGIHSFADSKKVSTEGSNIGFIDIGNTTQDFTYSKWINIEVDKNTRHADLVNASSISGSSLENFITGIYDRSSDKKLGYYVHAVAAELKTINAISINIYYHLTVMYKTDRLYLFLNGVYQSSVVTNSFGANRYVVLYECGRKVADTLNLNGYTGDIYFSLESKVTPTGYAVGQKVFEPPRRRSLDSNFIQYPIP